MEPIEKIVPEKISFTSRPASESEKKAGKLILLVSIILFAGLIGSLWHSKWELISWWQWLVGILILILFTVGFGLLSDKVKGKNNFFKIN